MRLLLSVMARKKRDLASAITVVSTEEYKQPVANVAMALQGLARVFR